MTLHHYTAFARHRAIVRLDELLLGLVKGEPEARHAWLEESTALLTDAPDYPFQEMLTSAIHQIRRHAKNDDLRMGVVVD